MGEAEPEAIPTLPEGYGEPQVAFGVSAGSVKALDVGRVRDYRGTLSVEEYGPIRKGLAKVFGGHR